VPVVLYGFERGMTLRWNEAIVAFKYVNSYSRTQLYLIFNYIGVYNNDMFQLYTSAIIRMFLDTMLRLY